MSSRAKKAKDSIVQQRITTVVEVLSIMQGEADKMSWLQRFIVAQQFIWKKDISCFFQLAKKNKRGKNEVQDSGKKS